MRETCHVYGKLCFERSDGGRRGYHKARPRLVLGYQKRGRGERMVIIGKMGLHPVCEMKGIGENIGRSSVLAQYGELLHVTEDRVEEFPRAG